MKGERLLNDIDAKAFQKSGTGKSYPNVVRQELHSELVVEYQLFDLDWRSIVFVALDLYLVILR